MSYLNQCNFIGNCSSNPEVRSFDGGGKIATTRIAITERYVDRMGNQAENTEWVSCVFNGKLADTAEKYITKGMSLFVTGKYRTRQWQDQSGNKHYNTEISVQNFQILDRKPQQAQASAPQPQYQQAPPAPARAPQPPVQPAPQMPPVTSPAYTTQEPGDLPF